MAKEVRSEAPFDEVNGKKVRRRGKGKKPRSSDQQPRQFSRRGTEVRKDV